MAVFLAQLIGALLCGIFLFVSLVTFAFMLIRLKPYEEKFRAAAENPSAPAQYDGYGKVIRRRAEDARTE